MTRAVICLRYDRADLQDYVRSMLQDWRVRICGSIEDVFEHLWANGSEVDLVVLEPVASHRDELLSTAENWPDLLFVAISDGIARPDEVPRNIVLLRHRDVKRRMLKEVIRWGERQGTFYLGHGAIN